MPRFFQETLKETHVKCVVILPKFQLHGGRLPNVNEEIELDLNTARWRERRGQVKIVGEPFQADTGVRVEDPPAVGKRWSATQW
jgi:hypothetical protein